MRYSASEKFEIIELVEQSSLSIRLPARQERLLSAEQQDSLRDRMSCGRDADCIENAYERRIRQLMA
jgi:hypothetical protein